MSVCYDQQMSVCPYQQVSVCPQTAEPSPLLSRPFHDVFLCSLKQRILAFLYRRALHQSVERRSPELLRHFYLNLLQFHLLKIWRMQLLDEDHILLKVRVKRLEEPTHLTILDQLFQVNRNNLKCGSNSQIFVSNSFFYIPTKGKPLFSFFFLFAFCLHLEPQCVLCSSFIANLSAALSS